MKAYLKFVLFGVLMTLFTMQTVFAVTSGTVDAVDADRVEKDNFTVDEDVYIKGTCIPANDLNVDVYVVEDQDLWETNNPLVDVTDSLTTIFVVETGIIYKELIWSAPLTPGNYDVIIDSNQNGVYNTGECIDTMLFIGFTIDEPVETGTVDILKGENDPGDHQWVLEAAEDYNLIMQLDLAVGPEEDITLSGLSFNAMGTGNDAEGVVNVLLVEDLDMNGVYDSETDLLWGEGTYAEDDGILEISTDQTLSADSETQLLLLYVMGDLVLEGETFSVELSSVEMTGVDSMMDIVSDSLLVISGETEVVLLAEEPVVEPVEEPVEEPVDETAGEFTDIAGHWAEEFIDGLRAEGIVSGKSEGIYEPDSYITRAELTKVALLAFAYEVPDTVDETPFTDIATGDWFAPFVSVAKDSEVVNGYEDGNFYPNRNVNRVEALKIIIEAAGIDPSGASEASFPDVTEGQWYLDYLNYAVEEGIVSGYTGGEMDGLFGPENYVTRAEVAKMIYLVMN